MRNDQFSLFLSLSSMIDGCVNLSAMLSSKREAGRLKGLFWRSYLAFRKGKENTSVVEVLC